jgi:hypothetical protein
VSLNYPNREDWLKVRCTPRKNPPGRYLHVSKPIVLQIMPGGAMRPIVDPGPGRTYRK